MKSLAAERFYQQAQEDFNCSKYEAAIDSLEQAIALQPDYMASWYLRILSYAKFNWEALDWDDNYFELAIASFDRAIAIVLNSKKNANKYFTNYSPVRYSWR